MIKAKEFAEGYVSFWYDSNSKKWQAMFINSLPTGDLSNYYRIKIPVPEEKIVQDLPNLDQIQVTE